MVFQKYYLRNTIKEALDDLPVGICFFNNKGLPVFINNSAREYFYELTKSDIQSLGEFEEKLADIKDFAKTAQVENSYMLPSDKVIQILYDRIEDVFAGYTQVTIRDITDLYDVAKDLKNENERLMQMNEVISNLSSEIKKTVKEEETFQMKIKMHDDMGRLIISAKKIYSEGGSLEEIKKNLNKWQKTIAVYLKSDGDMRQIGNREVLDDPSQDIGVKVHVTGKEPANSFGKQLYQMALKECVTNCINHAHGNNIYVKFIKDGNMMEARFTNDGQTPERTVVEGGGLKRLRKLIEGHNGVMSIRSFPRFQLIIRWKEL